MEDEITKTIQGLKLNEKKKVDYQGITYILINKNNKLFYKTESSLTFDIISYAIVILTIFFLIALGFSDVAVGLGIIFAIQSRLSYWLGFVDIQDIIYNQIVKKTTEEFINKYGNIKILEHN